MIQETDFLYKEERRDFKKKIRWTGFVLEIAVGEKESEDHSKREVCIDTHTYRYR